MELKTKLERMNLSEYDSGDIELTESALFYTVFRPWSRQNGETSLSLLDVGIWPSVVRPSQFLSGYVTDIDRYRLLVDRYRHSSDHDRG